MLLNRRRKNVLSSCLKEEGVAQGLLRLGEIVLDGGTEVWESAEAVGFAVYPWHSALLQCVDRYREIEDQYLTFPGSCVCYIWLCVWIPVRTVSLHLSPNNRQKVHLFHLLNHSVPALLLMLRPVFFCFFSPFFFCFSFFLSFFLSHVNADARRMAPSLKQYILWPGGLPVWLCVWLCMCVRVLEVMRKMTKMLQCIYMYN